MNQWVSPPGNTPAPDFKSKLGSAVRLLLQLAAILFVLYLISGASERPAFFK